MKIQRILIILISTFLLTQSGFSQEFVIPSNVKLESAEDYTNPPAGASKRP